MTDKKSVVVLGCGPAGLFAAHAVECAGMNVVIVSKKRKSEMFGAQYLHKPIPEVSDDTPFDVKYVLHGGVIDYRQKVYGADWRGDVSPESLEQDHQGWNIRAAYDLLWQQYQDRIVNMTFAHPSEVDLFMTGLNPNHVISTVPAHLLCSSQEHGFQAQKVWSLGDAPERGVFSPIKTELNTVECSGRKEHSWYRKSNILGFNTVEWPYNKKPPIEGVSEVIKPLKTNCNCRPEIHRVGRYGQWEKGVLSHEAFFQTYFGLTGEEWSD